MNPNDAALVKRVLAGEKTAFDSLIDRHWPRAMRLALRQLGNLADAEDVIQDAFFQAFLNLRLLKTPESFGAWLNGIVVNLCRMWHRNKRQDVAFEETEKRIISAEKMEDKTLLSPEALYETQESYQVLLAALATLPVAQRRAVHLHYLNGLTLREISTRAGVSVGAVKVRLHRARVKLSATLAGEGRRRQTTDTFKAIVEERSMRTQGKNMPLFPMRDIVVFPFMTVPLFLGRTKSIKALEAAAADDGRVFLVAQKDSKTSEPTGQDVFSVGTVAQVVNRMHLPNGAVRVLVEGKQRGRILRHGKRGGVFSAKIVEIAEQCKRTDDIETLMHEIKAGFGCFEMLRSKAVTPQAVGAVEMIDDPIPLGDTVSGYLKLNIEAKQQLLETLDPEERLKKILKYLPSDVSPSAPPL